MNERSASSIHRRFFISGSYSTASMNGGRGQKAQVLLVLLTSIYVRSLGSYNHHRNITVVESGGGQRIATKPTVSSTRNTLH